MQVGELLAGQMRRTRGGAPARLLWRHAEPNDEAAGQQGAIQADRGLGDHVGDNHVEVFVGEAACQ